MLRLIEKADIECPLEVDEASNFLSTIDLHLGTEPGMASWRKRLFLATANILHRPAEFFSLPHERTVIMGSNVDV